MSRRRRRTDLGNYRFFFYYRDISGTIYPVLEDLDRFEANLNHMLRNRASAGGIYRAESDQEQRPFGISLAFMGLLFAVLASGCQSSDLPSKDRELTSQVYGIVNRSPCSNTAPC